MAKKTEKLPEFLEKIDMTDFESFTRSADIGCIKCRVGRYYDVCFLIPGRGNKLIGYSKNDRSKLSEDKTELTIHNKNTSSDKAKFESILLYPEEDGTVWTAKLEIITNAYSVKANKYPYEYYWNDPKVLQFSLSKWTKVNKLIQFDSIMLPEKKTMEILKNINPYSLSFMEDTHCNAGVLLLVPFVEILHKAGFKFVVQFLGSGDRFYGLSQSELDAFNRLCGPGSNPKEIFSVQPLVYKALKDVKDIGTWDEIRKLGRKIAITPEAARFLTEKDSLRYIHEICGILKATYEEKPVFTVQTLCNYLRRLDTYEAIEISEALPLLNDYLSMCKRVGKKPIITGDSLKREHDITMRMCRDLRNEIYEKRIMERGKELEALSYRESIYFIRPITDFDDLLDESQQQNSCLAAVYPQRIASGSSDVFVMRETKTPDKSLATVELYPDKKLGQHFLSCNRKMTNPAQLNFLKRWLKAIA